VNRSKLSKKPLFQSATTSRARWYEEGPSKGPGSAGGKKIKKGIPNLSGMPFFSDQPIA